MNIKEARERFNRCRLYEYTVMDGTFSEDDANGMTPDPNAMGGGPNAMGGDPNAMGGDPSMMGGDPNAMGGGMDAGADPMGGDPSMMGGDPNAMGGAGDPSMMGGDPNAMGGTQGPQGFAPQGVDANSGLEGMGGEQPQEPANPEVGPDDDVVNVDDLTDAQKSTEKKVDDLSSKFERLMGSLDSIEKRIDNIDQHTNEYIASIKDEFEKRNPTPLQRMTMRSTKSAPYGMTPNEYMSNYAPDNYSDESDNNGADDPQYQITKGDIDNFTDYASVRDELGDMNNLRKILGY